MGSFQRAFVRAFVSAGFLISAVSHAHYVSDYSFPIQHPLKSTVASTRFTAPPNAVNTTLKLRVFDRKDNRARKDLKLAVYPAQSSSVVFVLIGLGGTAETPMAQFLASVIQAQGHTAVLVPNPMTAQFVLGASSTGIVGDVNRDALDTYNVLLLALEELRAQGLPAQTVSVLGYSLGGLLASRVAEIDAKRGQIGLRSTLLVNPPVDVLQGMRILDSYYAQFKSMGLGSLMNLANKIKKFVEVLSGNPTGAEAFALSDRELQGAIGYSMRDGFDDMILATQDIHEMQVLPVTESERLTAAKKIGFESYVTKILSPFLGRSVSLQAMAAQSSLQAQAGFLSSARNVFVMHNANDFLVSASDIQFIESTFRERARVYPAGGHMGNLDHPDNMQTLRNWLSGTPIN